MERSSTENIMKFQPMPKRFMVWDKTKRSFWRNTTDGKKVFDLIQLANFLISQGRWGTPHTNFGFLQSTNLFDKDGKEIFEGSIVNVYENYNFGNGDNERDFDGLVACHEGCWSVNSWNGEDELIEPLYEIRPEHISLVGHILSNPELLEEKNV